MYMSRYIAIIYSVFLNVSGSGCTQLFLNDSIIIENMPVNLTCTSSEPSSSSKWTVDGKNFHVATDSTTDKCFTQNDGGIVERCYHNANNTYIVTISPQRKPHGQKWRCNIYGEISDTILLNVSVPVYNVTLRPPGSEIVLMEGVTTNVSCITSYSRPIANITFYIEDKTPGSESVYFNEAVNTCSYTPDSTENSLVSTNCTVSMLMNRTYNGWNLVCTAETINNYSSVATGSITLNITYPTNKPTIQCTNNGIYRVVENTQGNLTCTVDGGNPAGVLHWNCTGEIIEHRGPQNRVTQTLIWNATQPQYCSCTALNIAGNQPTSIKTEVLYPPTIGAMKNTSVLEGDNVSLKCDITRANPPVNLIQWTLNRYTVSGATVTIENISRTDETVYTCTAYNKMDPSCRDVVTGKTSKSIYVDVLYPPSIDIPHGKTFTVKEGDTFNYTCPVFAGNPTNTYITWKRADDTRTWNSSQLLIHNVIRYDDSVYTCYASNVNSDGATRIGNVSADIRLVVQFKSRVIDFYIEGYGYTSNVIVNESVHLMFVCRLDGNPTADTRIYQSDRLVDSSNVNVLSYNTTSSCTGGPVNYICEGSNSLNTIPSTRHIELSVYCKPRRNMNVVNLIAACAINQTVTLTYTALAYPYPTFVWYRNGSPIDSSNRHFAVSSSELNTTLTINNIEESDFGSYLLQVTNQLCSIIETYELKPQGVPETPSHLTQNNDTTTDSMISITWTPGFNNGLEQTFTVLYKQASGDDWQTVSEQDTGSRVGYNITGLQSDTVYKVVLFSTNAMGRSRSNVTLVGKTKKGPVQNTITSTSPVFPAIGGSIAALVIVGVICVIVFFLRRRRFQKPTPKDTPNNQQQSSSPIPATYENLKMEQIPNIPIEYHREQGYDHTYEGLSGNDNDVQENEYSQLESNSENDPRVTYENLKIQI